MFRVWLGACVFLSGCAGTTASSPTAPDEQPAARVLDAPAETIPEPGPGLDEEALAAWSALASGALDALDMASRAQDVASSAVLAGNGSSSGTIGSGGGAASVSPTPAATASASPRPTPSATPSVSPRPTPSATPTASPTPSATPSASPTPTPSASPTVSPTPTPSASPSAVPVVNVTPPGPLAVRGRILLNGVPPRTPVSVTIIRNSDWNQRVVTTDAEGYFQATGLEPGSYHAHYYNETQRDRIGYWRSRTLPVDATRGAGFPQVDFGQQGLVNQPPMDARVTLPGRFDWQPPAQGAASWRFRVHSTGGRTFRLIYQSPSQPGNTTTFTWNGAGATEALSSTNRYFWGLVWDAGPLGEVGNLYQAVYFNQP